MLRVSLSPVTCPFPFSFPVSFPLSLSWSFSQMRLQSYSEWDNEAAMLFKNTV